MPGCFLIALVLFFLAAIAGRWYPPESPWYRMLVALGLFFLTLAMGWIPIRGMF